MKFSRTVSLSLIVIAGFILSACGGGGGGDSGSPAGNLQNGTITGGIVTGTLRGEGGVGSVPVFLIAKDRVPIVAAASPAPLADISGSYYSAITDESGNFVFPDVAEGVYNAIAKASSYESAVSYDISVIRANTVTISLTLTATGEIAGRIVPQAGANPLGAVAFVPGTSFSGFADSSGAFRLIGVPVGTYSVSVADHGAVLTTIAGVSVRAGTTTDLAAIVIDLAPSGPGVYEGIASKTVLAAGETDNGNLFMQISSGSLRFLTTTDQTGRFAFHHIPTGRYDLCPVSTIYRFPTPVEVVVGTSPAAPLPQFPLVLRAAPQPQASDTVSPSIVSLVPPSGGQGVLPSAELTAFFSENVFKGATGNITIHRRDSSVFEAIPVADSRIRVEGNALFIGHSSPFTALPDGYYIILDPSCLRDSAGNSFAGITASATWPFFASRFGVVSTLPQNASANALNTTSITLEFNRSLDPATVGSASFGMARSDGTPVQWRSVSFHANGRSATFVPESALESGASYLATMTTAIRDSAGIPLPEAFSFRFTVKDWTLIVGTPYDDHVGSIKVTPAGEIFLGGGTYGSIDGHPNLGGSDVFVRKMDPQGNLLWSGMVGTDLDEEQGFLDLDSSGNAYVAGQTRGAFPGFSNAGERDMFAARVVSPGTWTWVFQKGDYHDAAPPVIAHHSAGDVYVAGGKENFKITKLSASAGSLQWEDNSWGPYCGIFAAEGNILVTGDKLDGSPFNHHHQRLAKVDPGKGFLFTFDSTLETTSDNVGPAGCHQNAGGQIVFTGYSDVPLENGKNPNGGTDVYVFRLDSNGQLVWHFLLGTPQDDRGAAVLIDAAGNSYITGCTLGSLAGFTNKGSWDVILIKLDPAGSFLWTRQLGTPGADFGKSLAFDQDGNIVLAGETDGNLVPGGKLGGVDIFIAKFAPDGTRL